jgi:hypothetical protein
MGDDKQKGHTKKNPEKDTKNKHEEGDARRAADQKRSEELKAKAAQEKQARRDASKPKK